MERIKEHKALGRCIRELRRKQNISLRKFALMVGLSKDYMVDIEYGRKSPTIETLIKIANGLGISASGLLKEAERSEYIENDIEEDSNSYKYTNYHSTKL